MQRGVAAVSAVNGRRDAHSRPLTICRRAIFTQRGGVRDETGDTMPTEAVEDVCQDKLSHERRLSLSPTFIFMFGSLLFAVRRKTVNMDGSNTCSGSHMKHSGMISAGEEEERLDGRKIVY